MRLSNRQIRQVGQLPGLPCGVGRRVVETDIEGYSGGFPGRGDVHLAAPLVSSVDNRCRALRFVRVSPGVDTVGHAEQPDIATCRRNRSRNRLAAQFVESGV